MTEQAIARPQKLLLAALLAVVPLTSTAVGAVFLPRPQAAAEERRTVDRKSLGDAVSKTPPQPTSKVDAVLGDRIRVHGADAPTTPVERGSKLSVRFYFEALADLDRDWQIFVHVDHRLSEYRINGDHFPVEGRYATTLWQRGDVVADDWSRGLPLDAPAGTYDVYVGFYIGNDRLPFSRGDAKVNDGSNRVRVATITVE